MREFTVDTIRQREGLVFKRSDGEIFFLLGKPNGNAVLYHGQFNANPTHLGLVDLDVSVRDKLKRAISWVLAYPNQPES